MIARFHGAKSISSEQYYGEDSDSSGSYHNRSGGTDVGSIKDAAYESAKKIGNMASDWFNSLPSLEG